MRKKPATKKVRRGPPLDLTKEKVEQIAASIRLGARVSAAVLAAGFSRRAYQRWKRIGEQVLEQLEDGVPKAKLSDAQLMYAHFVRETRIAAGILECEATHTLYELARNDADALAAFLAKRFGGSWTDKKKLDVKHSGGTTLQVIEEIVDAGPDATSARPNPTPSRPE